MTNLDNVLKSRDITLPTKVRIGKAMVFPVVMYGCESLSLKVRPINIFQIYYVDIMSNFFLIFNLFSRLFYVKRYLSQQSQ